MDCAERAGLDLTRIASVASFFVSRVDTEVDSRLDKLGTPAAAAVRGEAAIGNARIAYQHYEQVFGSLRWRRLRAAGAKPQRPLWASTSTKDPSYPDTRYVVDLVAPGVVNTMAEGTLRAVADHGKVPTDSTTGRYADAQYVMERLKRLGIDYEDVVQQLEDEAVETFTSSWQQLGEDLGERMSPSRVR